MTFKVTIEKLTVHEHPNADLLELAQVGLYRAVVKKGEFQTGDYAIYIPEQAILPSELIEELGLVGYLAGKNQNRVKAVRLRGEISQGIVCRPAALAHLFEGELTWRDAIAILEADYAEQLGIVKWVPPIPVGMAGRVKPANDLVRWIEIENIKRFPNLFNPGEQIVATEKVHGTCCLYTYVTGDWLSGSDGHEYVSSKGFGGQNLALEDEEHNLYWRAVRQYDVGGLATFLSGYFAAEKVGVFGEVYGAGVQDLHYGMDAGYDKTIGYAVFDVAVVKKGQTLWVPSDELDALWSMPTDTMSAAPPRVPELYRGPYDYELLAKLAEGRSALHDGTIREGLVVRPAVERDSDVTGGRAIAKFVSDGYLLRGGAATEFE